MQDTVATRWAYPDVILVATDLSDLDRLMPVAFAQARETGARLLLFHALSPSAGFTADPTGMPYYDPGSATETAEHMLWPWCQRAQSLNIHCNAMVREGKAIDQILTVVRQFHPDRILLCTRSRSRLTKLLLGSVAEQVLRSVNLPVITVGPEAHLMVENGAPGAVLHATTLRETSRPSAALAYTIAAKRGAKLILLHVLPPADEMARKGLPLDLDSIAMRELGRLAADINSDGRPVKIDPVVVRGNPAIEILAEASARQAGLIVLGATRSSALESITRDHTVYRVLAHARCPVLTLREPLQQSVQPSSEQGALLHQ
ncbi:MAG TPA: universal stress protein [Terracidiphilus sp.]|nr:universal stress protein [Terracidiphilus sp.]